MIDRQGDVPMIAMPAELEALIRKEGTLLMRNERGQYVVKEGELTGHAYTIATPDVEVIEWRGMQWVLAPATEWVIEHQQHAPITRPAGVWQVPVQEEYDIYGRTAVRD